MLDLEPIKARLAAAWAGAAGFLALLLRLRRWLAST